jgi:hypothetical protein
MAAPLDAEVLARRTTWRFVDGPQFCDWCQVTYDGTECPRCGEPGAEEQVGEIVVAFSTVDGRRWVVWATRGINGRWVADRVRPAPAELVEFEAVS